MDMICEDFRQNIIDLLAKRGMTRAALASKMSVSPSFVSQVLNGDRDPGLKVVERFADALEVPAAKLFKKTSVTTAD